ncbi:hypothetical protein HZS55_15675 [Halosimplex rubrum]|uniref:Uncharacterized protein n=1 Tax=Halosimplex rubrum TaxID=869889 RepID=A0A7D5PBT0_9EURY|nr:hypothetical protein [Halosimplex rubrum]QLH78639.1 hypothetical protein HZS55_15675 [Halosimplex rubrum]
MTSDEPFEWSRTIANGFERCVWCGIVFGAEDRDDDIRGKEHPPGIGGGLNHTYGPVRDRSGQQYESVGASEPGSYLMHVDCYLEYHAEVASEENESLHEYATDGGVVDGDLESGESLGGYTDIRELHPKYTRVGCMYCDVEMWVHVSFAYVHDEGICDDCGEIEPEAFVDPAEVRV